MNNAYAHPKLHNLKMEKLERMEVRCSPVRVVGRLPPIGPPFERRHLCLPHVSLAAIRRTVTEI